MSKKILGPEIIKQRIEIELSNNVWYYVDIINRQLRRNPINDDKSIEATINSKIDRRIIEQIIDLYIDAGWAKVDYEVTGGVFGERVTTVFTFIP